MLLAQIFIEIIGMRLFGPPKGAAASGAAFGAVEEAIPVPVAETELDTIRNELHDAIKAENFVLAEVR
jgi:hypothetical protein